MSETMTRTEILTDIVESVVRDCQHTSGSGIASTLRRYAKAYERQGNPEALPVLAEVQRAWGTLCGMEPHCFGLGSFTHLMKRFS